MSPVSRRARTALALVLVAAPQALLAQDYPKTPPAAAAVRPTPLPPFQEAVLPNGVQLVLVEDHRLPVVSLSLSFRGGSAYDPAGKEGLAAITASLLTKGAGQRSADEISAAIEGVGGQLTAGAGTDFLTVRSDVLSSDAALAIGLVADAVARPTFPASELELLRTQTLSGLQLALSQPGTIAQRTFMRELYGRHPYGRSTTPASVRAITRDDVVRFHGARLKPQGALLVIAGDLTLADARRLAPDAFTGWTGAPAAVPAFPAIAARSGREIVLVHRPGSVQANIVVGRTTFGPSDPRYYPLSVASRVLGGGSNARLFEILREQKGWTYGSYSSFARPRGIGHFSATAETRNAVTDSALTELLAQLRALGTTPVPAGELAEARDAITGSFPLGIETANQLANTVTNMKLLGLPADYIRNYRTRIAAVTPVQLRTVAAQVANPAASVIVVVGDAEQLYDKLKRIAPVRVITVEGQPVNVAALSDKGASATFDVARLVPHVDSFAVLVQGNPFGYSKESIEKTAGGYRIVGESKLGPVMSLTSEIVLDAKGAVLSSKQTGTLQGQPMNSDLAYAAGRVKGTAAAPSPQGMQAVKVDTVVPAGTMDERSLTALLPTLRWTPTAKFTFPVFYGAENAVRTMTAAVTASEKVTVPAGTFDAYKVEFTGGRQAVTYHIAAAAPHRVLKIAPQGQPVEVVLAK